MTSDVGRPSPIPRTRDPRVSPHSPPVALLQSMQTPAMAHSAAYASRLEQLPFPPLHTSC